MFRAVRIIDFSVNKFHEIL